MNSYLVSISLIVVGAYLFYAWVTRNNQYWAKRGVAFVKPTPIFGCMLGPMTQTKTFIDTFKKIYLELKPHGLGGFFEFSTPMLMVTSPELIKEFTVKHFDHFADRRVLTKESTDPLAHRSLPSLKGSQWRDMRNSLSPAFTTSKLRGMFPLISRCGEQFASFLVKRPDAKNSPLEFKTTFTRFTNDVIATVAFGIECNAVKDPEEKFYKYGQSLTNISGLKVLMMFGYMVMPKVMEFFKFSFTTTEITNYFRNLVKGTMKYREENNMTRPDMLQLMMAAQKGGIERMQGDEQDTGAMGEAEDATKLHQKHLNTQTAQTKHLITDEDIAAQAFIFFFAGYETTATLLSFMAHEITVNKHIQERLRKEVDDVILENDGKLTYEGVQKLKYMDMVMSETLRKYPPAGFTDRCCTKTFKVPDTDIIIEKDTLVMIPFNPLHHDPEYFPNPDQFDPERFNDENKKNIKPYTYLPFGTGPHNCIGMRLAMLEVKTCIAFILATCELRVNKKTEVPLRISKKSVMLITDAGFWLTAAPRDSPTLHVQ